MTLWLGVDVGAERKGFDVAVVDERALARRVCGIRWTPDLATVRDGGADVPPATNQDQRDAIAAAVTARQHTQGLTEPIGEIVVPAAREKKAR